MSGRGNVHFFFQRRAGYEYSCPCARPVHNTRSVSTAQSVKQMHLKLSLIRSTYLEHLLRN